MLISKILSACVISFSLTSLASCSSQQNETTGNQQETFTPASLADEAAKSEPTDKSAKSPGVQGSADSESGFRDGVMVEFLYKEEMGNPYWTTWYGRLEKRDGPWRDVYVETDEKLVIHGVLSFQCDRNSSVAWVTYDDEQFGVLSARHIASVPVSAFTKWKTRELDDIDPPYELYQIARSKFC